MKLYEYDLQDNYTEIKGYGGGVYDGILEMQAVWKALGGALDGVRSANISAVDNQFVMYCDEAAITELEQWLYLPVDRTKSIVDRRAVVAALLRGFGHIGEREITDYVSLFTTGSIAVTFDPIGTVNVTITRDVEDRVNITDAYYVLLRRIPAHLTLIFHDNVLPISIKTIERVKLYSIAVAVDTYWDGEYEFDGAIDFSGMRITGIEYMEDGMASTITNVRMELLAAAARGQGEVFPITHIAFGDGGADSGGRPIEPDPAQTSLVHELGRYAIDSVESPVNGVSRFAATIPVGALPGAQISEAGLYDSAGNLVAVKNMPSKVKEADLQLVYSFDDEFTNG